MTDSSGGPVICHHSKRLQNISRSESESTNETSKKQKVNFSKLTFTTPSESEESVACIGKESPEQVLPAPKVNQFHLELEIERQMLRQLEIELEAKRKENTLTFSQLV